MIIITLVAKIAKRCIPFPCLQIWNSQKSLHNTEQRLVIHSEIFISFYYLPMNGQSKIKFHMYFHRNACIQYRNKYTCSQRCFKTYCVILMQNIQQPSCLTGHCISCVMWVNAVAHTACRTKCQPLWCIWGVFIVWLSLVCLYLHLIHNAAYINRGYSAKRALPAMLTHGR